MTVEQYRAIYNKFTEAQERGDMEAMRIAFLELYTHAVGLESNIFTFGSIAGSNHTKDPRVGIIRRLELANDYEAAEIAEMIKVVSQCS